jgi:PAS domain S-box-containing protein
VVFEDGTSIDLLGNVEPIPDEKGVPRGVVAVLSDITQRKQAEDNLREALRQLQLITDNMATGVTRCSRDLRYVWVSRSYAAWLGRTPEEIAGRSIIEVLGPEYYEVIRPRIEKVLSGERVEYEAPVNSPGIGTGWIHAVYVPTKDRNNKVDGWIAVVTDVTERHETEERLRASEARLIEAQHLAKVGSWERHIDGDTIHWSDEMLRILGLSDSAPSNLSAFLGCVHPKDREKILEVDAKVRSDIATVEVEYRIIRPNGETRFVRSIAEGIRNDQGLPVRIVGATQDITEQVRAEETLRGSEQRLKNAERLAHVGHWEWDVKTNRLLWSEETLRLFGRPQNYAPTYEGFLEALRPQDRSGVELAVRDCLAGTKRCSLEFQITQPDDDVRTLACFFEVVRDDAGSPIRVSGAFHDITDRERAEEERVRLAALVEKEHERLNAIISSIPGAVWETWGSPDNPAKQVKFISKQVEEMLGYAVEQWMTPPGLWPLIVHPDDRSQFVRDAIEIFTSDKGSGSHQYRCLTKDGRTVWLESHASVIREQTGKPIGLRGVTIDISERKEAHAALMRAREELARVSRAITMGEVAASIAHEINQPLSAVVTNGEACLRYLAATAPNIEKSKSYLD